MSLDRIFRGLVVVLAAGAILTGCGGAEERKARYLERAIAYFEEDNYEKATIEFKNVLQIDPKTASPYYYIGRIEEADNEFRKAFANYSKAVELDPSMSDARIRLGQIYLLAGDVENATKSADLVLADEPSNYDALTLRASTYTRMQRNDEAEALLKKILADHPGHENASVLLAAMYSVQKRTDEAIAVLESAAVGNANSVQIRSNLVLHYVKAEKREEAEKLMQDLVRDHPEELAYRTSLASFYAKYDRNDEAETVLREAIAADPEDSQRYLFLVDLLKNTHGDARAVSELQQMIAQQPGIVELRYALAQFHVQAGELDKAEGVYQAVIDEYGLEPPGLTSRTAIAAIRMQEGKPAEAKQLLEDVLAENATDSAALMLQGRIALSERDFVNAVSVFRSVLKGQSDSVEVLTLLAAAHEGNGEHELAIENLARAVDVAPRNIEARLRLATFYGNRGDLEKSMDHIDKVLELEPNSVAGLRSRAEVLARMDDQVALEETLDRLEQASPETGLGPFGKGRLYATQKKYPEAVAAFEQALAKEPDSVLVLTQLVSTEVTMGNTDGAASRLQQILADDPGNRIAHFLLGGVYMTTKQYAEAEAEFMQQLDVNSDNATIYAHISSARFAQGNKDGAIDILDQGLVALPDNADLLLAKMGIYQSQGDRDQAVAVMQHGIKAVPQEQKFPLALGGLYEKEGQVEKAIEMYESYIKVNPDALLIVNNLAALLTDHRSDEQSLARAVELAERLAGTNQPAMLDTLGWAYYKRGDINKAASVLAGVVEQAPDIPIFRYHLGMAYYKQGDKRAAREILAKAVGDDYTYPGIEEARQVYQELGEQ